MELSYLIVPFFCPFRPIFTWEEEPNLNIVPAESPETTGNEQKVQLATHEGPRDDGKDTTEVKEYPFSKSSEAGKEVQEGENKEATKGSEAEVKEREEIKKNNDAEEKAEQDRNTAKENSDNGTNKQNNEKVQARKCLPGPSWPLDSHPDRVKEFLEKWNMFGNDGKPPKPPQKPNVERPEDWKSPMEFVDPKVQAPQKPRGRKPRKTKTGAEKEKPDDEELEAPKRTVAPKKVAKAKASARKKEVEEPSGGGERRQDGKDEHRQVENQRSRKRSVPSKHEPFEETRDTKKQARTNEQDAAKKRKASQRKGVEQSGQDSAKGTNETPPTKDDKEKEDMLRERKARISRKSAAYHAARKEALQQGMDALNAKELAKEVRNLGVQPSNLRFIISYETTCS